MNLKAIYKTVKKNINLVLVDPNGSMYNKNGVGPRMEPCGTQHESGAAAELKNTNL